MVLPGYVADTLNKGRVKLNITGSQLAVFIATNPSLIIFH